MAVAATNLTTAGNNADATSYASASITPTANRLILAWFYSDHATVEPNAPTVTGNGLTWVLVASRTQGTNRRMTLYRAMGSAPTAGAVTFDLAGQTATGAMWSIAEFSGVHTGGTNGSAAIANKGANSASTGTSLIVTMQPFSDTDNATAGAFMHAANETRTVGAGFTSIGVINQASPNVSLGSQFLASNDTTVDASWTTTSANIGIAVEIREAASVITPQVFGVGTQNALITAVTPGIPAGTIAGDLMIMLVETNNEAITVAGWTEALGSPQSDATDSHRLTIFYRYATSNNQTDASVTSDSGDHQVAQIFGVHGAVTSGNPFDTFAAGTDTTSDTTGSVPGSTTTIPNTLVIAVSGTGFNGTSTTEFTGWTNADLAGLTEFIDNVNTIGLGGGFGAAFGRKLTAGAYANTTVTHTNASRKGLWSAAIKPLPITLGQTAFRFYEDGTEAALVDQSIDANPTVGTKVGDTTFVATDGGYLRTQAATNFTSGRYNFTGNLAQDFYCKFDAWAGGGSGADALWFHWGAIADPTQEDSDQDQYAIVLSEFADQIQIRYAGAVVTSSAFASLDNSTWRTVEILVQGDNIKVWIDTVSIFDYNDTTRTLGGTTYGWGGRSGSTNNEHRIRNLLVANDAASRPIWPENNAIDEYGIENRSTSQTLASDSNNGFGQSFTGDGSDTDTVFFALAKQGSPTGNAVAKVYAHSGTFGTSSIPTGAALATSNNLDVASLTTSFSMVGLQFTTPFITVKDTKYCVVIEYSGGAGGDLLLVGNDNTSSTHSGNTVRLASGTWNAHSTQDCIFSLQTNTRNVSSGDSNLLLRLRIQESAGQPGLSTDDYQLQYEKNDSGEWKYVGNAVVETFTSADGNLRNVYGSGGADEGVGQSITTTIAHSPNTIDLRLQKFNSPADNLTLEIRSTSITGSLLATSDAVSASGISTSASWVSFTFSSPPSLSASTQYFLRLTRSGARDTTNRVAWAYSTTSAYAGGGAYSLDSSVWSSESSTNDHGFRTNVLAGTEVIGYNSASLTDGNATTQRLNSGTNSFLAGEISEDGLVDDFGITVINYTELLYSLTIESTAVANNDTLDFRVLRNSAVIDTYTVTPRITIIKTATGSLVFAIRSRRNVLLRR